MTIATKLSTKAEHDGSKEEAGHGGPGECQKIFANACFKVSAAESITAFNNPGSLKGSGKTLEEEGNRGSHGREVSAKTAAESQKAGEERDSSKDKCDEVKGEHEAGEIVVHVGANKLLGNVLLGTEVSRWMAWQRRHNVSAIVVVSI